MFCFCGKGRKKFPLEHIAFNSINYERCTVHVHSCVIKFNVNHCLEITFSQKSNLITFLSERMKSEKIEFALKSISACRKGRRTSTNICFVSLNWLNELLTLHALYLCNVNLRSKRLARSTSPALWFQSQSRHSRLHLEWCSQLRLSRIHSPSTLACTVQHLLRLTSLGDSWALWVRGHNLVSYRYVKFLIKALQVKEKNIQMSDYLIKSSKRFQKVYLNPK